ncbi:Tetratricopeptide TPR_2 repeat protein (plasmid) [Methylobacterium nodulans ORS 2060]|uniref:Tetratricopeptide TPR_2 repeat protein n=1 Tax=Methylobacterium nodulans (strain LMG 21967 / CNCM I-2342 / ORS 2060) TaxID=460265 RepID=B8IXN2_METNO|nr:Tetratricopeptide TPR_2 repeat protein [Methylobacterium nodulans ORS 2060]
MTAPPVTLMRPVTSGRSRETAALASIPAAQAHPARPAERVGWARAGDDPVQAVRAAEALRDAGDVLEAAAILTQLCRLFAHLPYGWRELAVLRQRAGDAEGAARDFARALAADPGDLHTLMQSVRHSAGMGRLDEAQACLSAFVPRTPGQVRRAERLEQLVAYMRRHPETEAMLLAMAIRTSPRHLGIAAVEARIAAALEERRPFSLIRLGDGEGAWISDPDEEGGRFRSLYRNNRKRILRTWFGNDDLIDRADFLALRDRFLATIPTASVVGVTYPERIRHEYGIASLDGVPSCTNVLRHVSPLLHREGVSVCTHDIHLDLHLSGALQRLMTSGHPVGLISCHPQLAGAISRRFGTRIAAALLIPEEKRFAPIIGATGMQGAHYPEAFGHVMARLRQRDWSGIFWLVAAGYLGKLYCHEIAARGGVAVDIGSIADAWSGKATRPGLSNLDPYRL